MSDAWHKLKDGKSYKVYHNGGRWLLEFPYTVVDPEGRVINVAATKWGARRMIRKHQAGAKEPGFWEDPIVEEIPEEPT